MSDYKCAFSITQMKNEFGCGKASMVTRRGGPDIACASQAASQRCERLHEYFKNVGLPAFDAEDDLLSVPHSVLAKIQFGGLLGLQHALTDNTDVSARVEDIHALVEHAVDSYGALENIPCDNFVDAMRRYPLRRRRR